ncbi:MAG: AIPR protein, partial [Sphingobacteriaceae bacterium]
MDRITRNLLKDFVTEQGLSKLSESDSFERFSNYCVVASEYSDTFNVEEISCGSGNDTGLDGIAVLVNGRLVTTEDEIEDLCRTNGYLEAIFIFVQAKTSSNFDGGDIGTFCFGVKDFFEENPRLPRNDFVKRAARLQEAIYQRSALMSKGKPICLLYYVTTGVWNDDTHLRGRIDVGVKDIEALLLFKQVGFKPVDANLIQLMYQATKNKVTADFIFVNKTVLPEIDGVKESYLGVLPALEYVRILEDEAGNIRKSLFYDNVRDFQDYNDVNKEVRNTLLSNNSDRFAVLNNGITLVARVLSVVGSNKFHIEDYQIVNGCQTSHVIFNERNTLNASVYVPIKVISTTNESVTNEIIKATNRQTEVKEEELNALLDFEKKLEAYFHTYENKKSLYYERRSRQYNGQIGIEKVRIVTRSVQIKAFASMFLDEPHRAGRYYGDLLKLVPERIFSDNHQLLPYYTSAYAQYKLE